MKASRLEQLYKTVILEHSKSPLNRGKMDNPSTETMLHNPSCGDTIVVQVKLNDDIIDEIQFTGDGCAISMASASIMTQALKGKTIQEAQHLITDFSQLVQGQEPQTKQELGEAAALQGVAQFPARIRCAQLAWKALEQAIQNLNDQEGSKANG